MCEVSPSGVLSLVIVHVEEESHIEAGDTGGENVKFFKLANVRP
jgi:hypothetical protein